MSEKNKYQVQEIIDTDSNGTPDAAVIKKSTAKGGKIPETPSESETLNSSDKESFTDEQLATLNDDLFYTKMAEEESNALQAGDKKAAEFARKIRLKRARELLEGYGSAYDDKQSSMGPETVPGPYAKYVKKGKRGRFSTELDANPEWWDSEPDEADNWWKETLKDADTVDVIENGPAGGNPMFTLTSNNRDALMQALKRYNNENGPDEEYYGPSDDELNDWIHDHGDDGDDGDDTELDSTGTMSSTDENDDDSSESLQNIVAALKDKRF